MNAFIPDAPKLAIEMTPAGQFIRSKTNIPNLVIETTLVTKTTEDPHPELPFHATLETVSAKDQVVHAASVAFGVPVVN